MASNSMKILIYLIVVCFIGILLVLGYYMLKKPVYGTDLYFNFDSDLPDPFLYLKAPQSPINILEVGKSYRIIFTIASDEKSAMDYTYIVSSRILNQTERFTLIPKENKTVYLTITPQESQKWTSNYVTSSKSENVLDLTKYSWLAERKEFLIITKDGLPAIVEENYNLPISFNISPLGRVYHVNISLDELRKRPFTREYTVESYSAFEKVNGTIDKLSLYVSGDKLYATLESKRIQYISEPDVFSIRLISGRGAINETTGMEQPKEIHFLYQIK